MWVPGTAHHNGCSEEHPEFPKTYRIQMVVHMYYGTSVKTLSTKDNRQ